MTSPALDKKLKEFDKKFTVVCGTKRLRRVGYWLQPYSEFPTAYPADEVKAFLHSLASEIRKETIEEERQKRQQWVWQKKMHAKGLCKTCGKPVWRKSSWYCEYHRQKINEYHRNRALQRSKLEKLKEE